MKANKETLRAVKSYLQNREGYDLEEVINDIVSETGLLEMEGNTLSLDECSINWDENEVCLLDYFVSSYTELFIDKICNVVDSFVDEDIDLYLYKED